MGYLYLIYKTNAKLNYHPPYSIGNIIGDSAVGIFYNLKPNFLDSQSTIYHTMSTPPTYARELYHASLAVQSCSVLTKDFNATPRQNTTIQTSDSSLVT